jgi:phytoene dehydrogenase-like protein
MPERPFVLVAQPSVVDSTRSPRRRHTGWAYAHVPHAWPQDVTSLVEEQVERFAPGFRDTILARSVLSPAGLEANNPNDIGGHIIGGVADVRQLFTRPVARLVPYTTPDPSVFICSSSTPPGAGVHGMCGYHAARAALARRFG